MGKSPQDFWEKARGEICPSCGREVFRLIGKICPRCFENLPDEIAERLRRLHFEVERKGRDKFHCSLFNYHLDIYFSPDWGSIYYKPAHKAESFAFRYLENQLREWAERRGLGFRTKYNFNP